MKIPPQTEPVLRRNGTAFGAGSDGVTAQGCSTLKQIGCAGAVAACAAVCYVLGGVACAQCFAALGAGSCMDCL